MIDVPAGRRRGGRSTEPFRGATVPVPGPATGEVLLDTKYLGVA